MGSHRGDGSEHWLFTRRVNRRRLLAAVPGGLLIAAGLAACGGDDDDEPAAPTATTAAQSAATQPPATDASPTTSDATPESGELRLIPLPPAELGAPAVPEPLPSANAEAIGVAEAVAAYDEFGTDAAPGVFPRTIRHAMGETTIESQPVRVVVLDSGELDSVVRLGVKPVGALEYDHSLLPDYLVEGLSEATSVGTLAEPDIEAIAALQPDLILSSMVRHEALYDTLAQIAPTVFGISTGVVWKQNFAQHARALGREVEAAEAVREYEERVRDLNAKLPEPRPTVSVVRVLADNLRYYQLANYSGTILTDLGLPRPDSQNVDDFALLNQSLETLGQFADADFIFVSPALGENDEFTQDMLDGPLWQSLSAVQEGNYKVVLDDVWMAGIGYRAAQVIMDEIEEALSGFAGAPASPSTSDGEWSFTDDRGETITLPQRPERIVPYVPIAASLWDFGVRPVGVFGTTRNADGDPEITTGDLDFDTVESLGETYGEIDMEALVALKPDLILYDIYGEFDLWGLPPEVVAQVEAIAPIAGISFVNRPVDETIGKIEELAGLLGADLSAPDVVEARERFDEASEAVRTACAEKDGLLAIFSAGWTDNFYVANPPVWTDLIYFQNLGLDVVVPDIDEGELWETLSWEQANKYQVDLILNDARVAALAPEQLAEYPTWMAQPAVKAGQVGEWYTEFVPSYKGFAGVLESLAETIEASDPDVV